ncbi:MAG: restriction endonuclease subunit S, partial [Flavobacteriales bacterium]|nr:restriction endonuclease subunit S [Flavobacteriales bacterium]
MLGEHVEILSGYAFKSKEFNDTGLGIPVVRIRDVGKEKSETFYDGEYSDDYLLDNGDLLIGMDGDFRLAKWKGGKALLNQRVCKITPKDSSLDRVYMYYMLPRELKRIEDTTSFATVKHLSVKKIKNIEIPLPPLDQQKKIAAILDAADAYRQKTKALIEKYDELTQSLFLNMFGDRSKFNRIKLSQCVTEKNDFVDGPFGSNLKVSHQTPSGVRLIKINNIGVGEFRDKKKKFTSEKKYFELIRHSVQPGDIIIAKMGEPLGRACLVPDYIEKGLVVADCMRMRMTSSKFLKHFV